MFLLPHEKFTLITKLKPQQISKRLQNNVATGRISFWKRLFPDHPYTGEFSDEAFRLRRSVTARNSVPVIIEGKIISHFVEQHIDVSMRLPSHYFVSYGISFLIFLFFGWLTTQILNHYSGFLFPVIMMLVAYIGTIISFRIQVHKAKKHLRKCWTQTWPLIK